MMNDDMLRNIEYLREKADVSYEEAGTLLERFDGNVMRVLVELERQGRVYPQGHGETERGYTAPPPPPINETREKAQSMFNKAFQHHIIVEKGTGKNKSVIADLSAPYVAGATVVAPWLTAASVGIMFACGYKVRWRKEGTNVEMPDDVESFVEKTVSNAKKTAASFTGAIRHDDCHDHNGDNKNDDNDEGGEITVE